VVLSERVLRRRQQQGCAAICALVSSLREGCCCNHSDPMMVFVRSARVCAIDSAILRQGSVFVCCCCCCCCCRALGLLLERRSMVKMLRCRSPSVAVAAWAPCERPCEGCGCSVEGGVCKARCLNSWCQQVSVVFERDAGGDAFFQLCCCRRGVTIHHACAWLHLALYAAISGEGAMG